VEYVEAIDRLLGLVGHEVLVRVADTEHHPGFVMLNGTLRQGEQESSSGSGEGQVSFFAVGEGSSAGFYIYRDNFAGASYDAEADRLTIWLGAVAVGVEPRSPLDPG
jgi:hypothetical protein